MSVQTIIHCDGQWAIPCRRFIPVPFGGWQQAYAKAQAEGWTREDRGGGSIQDFCEACSRNRARREVVRSS